MSRYLGVDYGSHRVGLAISDPLGMTAQPLEVVPRAAVVQRVSSLVKERDVGTLVIGLPAGLSGSEGEAASRARELGSELEETTGIPVVYFDERFTSRLADDALVRAGVRRRERRSVVNKVAAAIILQDYLDLKNQNDS